MVTQHDILTRYAVERVAREITRLGAEIAALKAGVQTNQLPNGSLDEADTLQITDGNGTVLGSLGQQGDGTYTLAIANQAGPVTPTDPIVASTLLGLGAVWDGNFVNGVLPVDWDHLEVHMSTSPTYTPGPTTLQGTLRKPGVYALNGLSPSTTYYICFVSVNASGAQGVPTNKVGAIPASVPSVIPAGSITSTMITDGSITTPKLAANSVTADQIAANSIVAGMIAAGAIDGLSVNAITINGSMISGTDLLVSGVDGGLFVYNSGGTITRTYNTVGTFSWICPPGVTSATFAGTGSGGGGAQGAASPGGGGGAGEYHSNTVSTTPGVTYTIVIPAGGAGGNTGTPNGGNGGDCAFKQSTTFLVSAHGGNGGTSAGFGGSGGTGASGGTVNAGGNGGNFSPTFGGGGGSSGGPTSPGQNAGSLNGATAVPGGGPGGDGGSGNGHAPSIGPGGGGGGAGNGFTGGSGFPGQGTLTYTSTTPLLTGSFVGAATTDPLTSTAVAEGLVIDNVSVSSSLTVSGKPVAYSSVVKPSDQSRVNNTISADTDLTVPISASCTYEFSCIIYFAALSGADIQWNFSVPTGANMRYVADYVQIGGTRANPTMITGSTTLSAAGSGLGTNLAIRIDGTIVVSTTGGNCVFNWAQNTTNAGNATTVKQYSKLTVRRTA